MATKVTLPKLGQTMEEGTIVAWLKKEGDAVAKGDELFNVESDKAVLPVEAKTKGILRKILVPEGGKIPVLAPVAIIGEANEDISSLLADQVQGPSGVAAAATAAPAPTAEAPAPAAAVTPAAPIERDRLIASPRARRVAAEEGADLAYVAGSGPEGRIIEKDVRGYLGSQPAATPLARQVAQELGVPLGQVSATGGRITAAQVREAATSSAPAPVAAAAPAPALLPAVGEIVPMKGVRAIIAERMATSDHTTAPVTLQSLVDATELVALRTRLKEALAKELGFDVGYNDIIALIVARCLAEYPYMNVRLEAAGIRHLPEVNVGLAVDSERGLLVPVIHGADKMGIKELAKKFRELVARAREGKSGPDDLTGGTFTITNLGMFGVDTFTPIINLPECAILGVGRIRPEAAVVGGQIVVRQHMWLSLTFDHRLVDGGPAARFLQGIMRYLESPYLLLA
jgi:pyruvate dehydrogenase E2 component (dihydrolipoamide acetyltransferase)